VQTKQEIAAKGKKAARVVAGYNTAGTRVWEMTREVQFLDELRGKPGVAQIVGLVTQGKADTTRRWQYFLKGRTAISLPFSSALPSHSHVHCFSFISVCGAGDLVLLFSTRAGMLCMPHKTA
jgi:hypothetical protein